MRNQLLADACFSLVSANEPMLLKSCSCSSYETRLITFGKLESRDRQFRNNQLGARMLADSSTRQVLIS